MVGVWGILRKKKCRNFRPDINRKWAKIAEIGKILGENSRKLYLPGLARKFLTVGIEGGFMGNILKTNLSGGKWGQGIKIDTLC